MNIAHHMQHRAKWTLVLSQERRLGLRVLQQGGRLWSSWDLRLGSQQLAALEHKHRTWSHNCHSWQERPHPASFLQFAGGKLSPIPQCKYILFAETDAQLRGIYRISALQAQGVHM